MSSFVECTAPVKHAGERHPHPVTGRIVCWVCHPPASVIREQARAQGAQKDG